MSPRPRKVSDEDIFAATYRAMSRLGPGELTLADIAAEAGVTAGAISQRFGSKRALLLALSEGAAEFAGDHFQSLRAAHRSPLAAVRAYAAGMAHLAESPAALARNLAYLQIDLSDAEFRTHLAAHARATRSGLEDLFESAKTAGELRPDTNLKSLAATVEVVLHGSLLTWALYNEGDASHWILRQVNAVLSPHLAPSPVRKRTKRRR